MNTAREAAIWELEEKHLTEKTNLAKRQLKDLFSLKRLQMMTRHEKVIVFLVCPTLFNILKVRMHQTEMNCK